MINEPSSVSGSLTVATTVVSSKAALLTGVMLNPAAAASTVTLFDNGSAGSGTMLALLTAVANGTSVSVTFNSAIFCANGITAVVTGTGATAQVYYVKSGG
jgi:hypothetical protein